MGVQGDPAFHRNFAPEEYADDAPPEILGDSGETWTPLFRHDCSFPPEIFSQVMQNLIRNPNINSSFLFRADILFSKVFEGPPTPTEDLVPKDLGPFPEPLKIKSFTLKEIIVRKLIPRNPQRDDPLNQTCLIFTKALSEHETSTLVIYQPHIADPSQTPFYHPAVHGIAFLHNYKHNLSCGTISIHYSFFTSLPHTPKLVRTAHHLLGTVYKHGQGCASGYEKRVNHDVILPQKKVQDCYAELKQKYAKDIIARWIEQTDPAKHVFEDLGIAAFLIVLWQEMYGNTGENVSNESTSENKVPSHFPGFVDIGCGNGLVVHILLEEGYHGWGFDARKRKSWDVWSSKAQANLKELVLIPSILTNDVELEDLPGVHDGKFPKGTFIISNHADELTPWTPILAASSECPFLMIPCCSHSLSGARFRAPAVKVEAALQETAAEMESLALDDGQVRKPKAKGSQNGAKGNSAYAALVLWVEHLARECGYQVEREMLRIPSTRNTGILGRKQISGFEGVEVDLKNVVERNGGAVGWVENARKLVKGSIRGH